VDVDFGLFVGYYMGICDNAPIWVPDNACTTSTPLNAYLDDTWLHGYEQLNEC
jgi:hypothetical protein